MGTDEETTIAYTSILKETDKAYHFDLEGDYAWIPKSQVSTIDVVAKKITIPKWLLRNIFPDEG